MQVLPQIAPITQLQRDHRLILSRLKQGPVILTQHSKPAAVLVSADQWDETAKELKRLQRIIAGDRAIAAVRSGEFHTEEEVDALLGKRA
jgi:prevent-host-death family protein